MEKKEKVEYNLTITFQDDAFTVSESNDGIPDIYLLGMLEQVSFTKKMKLHEENEAEKAKNKKG